MTKLLIPISIILIVLFIGCGNSADVVPPKFMPGQDACDHCFMIINELNYAAAVTLKNGEEKRFDDIGCMLSYADENKTSIKYYWVNDFNSEETIPAEKAFFVRSKNQVTPMGSGILAFSSEEKAGIISSRENLSIVKFNDLNNNNNK
jgi:copper chaperone NosL